MYSNTFPVRRLFFLYARGDAARIRPIIERLKPYDGFIWTSSSVVSQRVGINQALARGSEWLANDWLIGCRSERSENALWLRELQGGSATGIVGLNRRAVVCVPDSVVPEVADIGSMSAGTRRSTAVQCGACRPDVRLRGGDLGSSLRASGSGGHAMSATSGNLCQPVLRRGQKVCIDAEGSFDIIVNSLVRTVLPAEELRESLAGCYQDACRILADLRRREAVWQNIAVLRATVHQAIRDRYIHEKIENDEMPDQSAELGPWRRLDYVRSRCGLPFANGVFDMMEAHHDTLWFAGDIERTLAPCIDEFLGALESFHRDLKMLCLCSGDDC